MRSHMSAYVNSGVIENHFISSVFMNYEQESLFVHSSVYSHTEFMYDVIRHIYLI